MRIAMIFRTIPKVSLLASMMVLTPSANGQIPGTESPLLTSGTTSLLIPGNSIAHITTENSVVWIGGGKGLARSADAGFSWESFRNVSGFTGRGIFGIALRGNTIWTSQGFSREVNGQRVQTGGGYTYSSNNGESWSYVPQTLDASNDSLVTYGQNTVRFLPIVVPEQNVTFDLALSSTHVWIASWSSGLRRSGNSGQTWERLVLPNDNRNSIAPSDSLHGYLIDPRLHNNFLVFSVFVQDDSTIWSGTAGGINKSTDGGMSWRKFNTLNQASPILGNWVIAIAGQRIDSTYRLWATNWKADLDPREEFGVSYSDDGGRIWKNHLHGIRAYDFAFKGSTAYVATSEGIYRTSDGGVSWTRSGSIVDRSSGQRITTSTFFSIGVVGDTVFAGSGDGLVKTIDNSSHPFGTTWQILRTYQQVGNTNTTYAYPNPFSPDDEIVRLHYSTAGQFANVSIEIFDFAMNRVRTLIHDAPRSGTQEHDEIWNGRDDNNNQVANGVYFYRVRLDDQEPSWGKVMVLQ